MIFLWLAVLLAARLAVTSTTWLHHFASKSTPWCTFSGRNLPHLHHFPANLLPWCENPSPQCGLVLHCSDFNLFQRCFYACPMSFLEIHVTYWDSSILKSICSAPSPLISEEMVQIPPIPMKKTAPFFYFSKKMVQLSPKTNRYFRIKAASFSGTPTSSDT